MSKIYHGKKGKSILTSDVNRMYEQNDSEKVFSF
jgi:hypothetical protein